MRRALVSLVAALVALASPGTSPAQRARSMHDVPLVGNHKHLVVEATVNSALSGPMLVDTGASYCVLTRDAARRLGLAAAAGRPVAVATANGQVHAGLLQLDSMQIRGARASRVDTVVMDAVEPPLIGIIGLSFLTRFRFSVDHAAGTLRLEH
jgi:clan AA aspartic protease (TIGR02281 family)